MSLKTIQFTPELYEYYLNHSLREPAILKKCRVDTYKKYESNCQISPEQGQFMQLLVGMLNAKKTIDIGTFTGYSALCVALALPADGKLMACDVSAEWTEIAKQFWKEAGVDQKIELKLAPALETLDQLIASGDSGTYDFIFIDADKQNYIHYYEKSLQLIRAGGLIAIDNVLWGGRVADVNNTDISTQVIRELNSKILCDSRVNMSMVPISDGLTLVRKL